MQRIIYLFLLVGSINIGFGQNSEMVRKSNLQNSWVKNVPFEAIPLSQGSGKVLQVSKNPANPFEMYVAVAQSGVWHSVNNGVSFQPIFTDELAVSISAMGIHWASKTVWIANEQGVFYTEDNGKKWNKTALSQIKNATNFVFISASEVCLSIMGDASSEKGIFKTSDKGKTWEQTFGQVGVTHLVQAPNNPDVLYLAAWDNEVSVSNIVFSGKKSGIYKSIDKGNTWNLLTGQNSGFIQNNVGKISLAVFNHNSVYAVVDNRNRLFGKNVSEYPIEKLSSDDFLELDNEKIDIYLASTSLSEKYTAENIKELIRSKSATPSTLGKYLSAEPELVGAEVYHSADGGTTWKKQNDLPMNNVFYNRGYAVASLVVNPRNEKELYLSGIPLLHSTDAGKSWELLKDNPLNTEVYQFSTDGKQFIYVNNYGFFQSFDNGKTWSEQPLPQSVFIRSLAIGNPDRKTIYASVDNIGIWQNTNGSWQQISKENGKLAVDTNGKYYIAQPFGNILFAEKNQWKKSIPSYNKDGKQRFNKITPLLISPQNNSILYTGSDYLFQSLNEGKQWNMISNNLTNGDKGGNQPYGTISAIAESPFQFGLLYTGSDDGMIYTSPNGGVSWQMVYSSFPQPNSVVCLVASRHEKNRVYAVLKNQNGGQALVFRSENSGKTWENLKANLPNENVNVLAEDDTNEQLLYLGTESGLYVSFDRGEKWHIFQRNLPRMSVNEIVINPQTHTLYIGTEGRGIFCADIRPLKELRAAVRNQVFYPLKETYEIAFSPRWGNKTNAWEKAQTPELRFDAFASQPNEIMVKVLKDGILLSSFKHKVDEGFNYLSYNLVVSEEGKLAHEKKKQTTLYKKSSDGNYYLPKGNYQLLFEGDLVEEERILQVK